MGIETPDPPKTDVIVAGGVGELYISGDPESIRIYTANGILVSENRKSFQCPSGIYIVIVDGETRKVNRSLISLIIPILQNKKISNH